MITMVAGGAKWYVYGGIHISCSLISLLMFNVNDT